MTAAASDAKVFLRLNPLVIVATVFILGLVAGRARDVPAWMALAVAVLGILVWILAERWRGGMGRHVAVPALGLAIFAGSAALWSVDQRQVPANELARFLTSDRPVFLTGRFRIATEPVLRERPESEPAYLGPGTTSCLVDAAEVLTTAGWVGASGTGVLNVRGDVALHRGQVIEVTGFAKRPSAPLNPAEFDFARYLAASRLFATVTATRSLQVKVIDDRASPSLLESFRRNIRGKLAQHIIPRDDVAGHTLSALLLGQRDPAIESVGRDFAAAGAAHLLAISGAHIVIVAIVVWWILRWVIRRPHIRTLVTLGVVLLYVAATPCGPPILRAAIAAVALAAGRFSRRPTSAANLLAAATIIVLMLRPGDLLDAGFQLSFGCTAGLIFFADRIHRGLFGAWLERRARISRAIGTTWSHRRQRARVYLTGAITANLVGAGVAAPLVAFHFHQANPLAVVSGLVLLPVVTLTMGAGALQLVAEVLGGAVAAYTAHVVTGITSLMIWAVGRVADLPGSCIAVREPPVWLVVGFYGVLVLWAIRRQVNVSRSRVVLAGVLSMVIAAGWYMFTQETAPRISILAMGNGSAMVLETPGRTVVINAGSTRREPTQRIIDPFLRSRGINSVDTLVFTQIDRPHTSGGMELAEIYRAGTFLVSEAEFRRRGFSYVASEFLDRAQRRQVRQIPLSAGGRFDLSPAVQCEALWPPDGFLGGLPAADSGLILRLVIERTRVLIVDANAGAALDYVLRGEPGLSADVVILTGAAPSLEMMARVGVMAPRVIICADAAGDDPSILALNRLGQIDVLFSGTGIEVRAASGPRRF